jgi:hypothetical protein
METDVVARKGGPYRDQQIDDSGQLPEVRHRD